MIAAPTEQATFTPESETYAQKRAKYLENETAFNKLKPITHLDEILFTIPITKQTLNPEATSVTPEQEENPKLNIY